jgi:hypothetical protein
MEFYQFIAIYIFEVIIAFALLGIGFELKCIKKEMRYRNENL